MTNMKVKAIECPYCKHVVGHYDTCENCGNPLPKGLQEMLYAQMVTLTNRVERLFRAKTLELEPIPSEYGEEAYEVQTGIKKSVVAVDKLAPTGATHLKWVTNGTGEVQEVVGREHTRRSVLLMNTGQPAVTGVPGQGISAQPAIAASSCFYGFGWDVSPSNGIWLPPNAIISLDYTGPIYVTDAAIAQTVLSIVILNVR